MSIRPEHVTLRLPDYWTPEQALAVYELLKDLTDLIWHRYDLVLIEQLRGELDEDDSAQPHLLDFDDPLNF